MLYWREVSALRRENSIRPHRMALSREERNIVHQRDQFVQERIQALETDVSNSLQNVSPYGFSILLKMADSYSRSFATRALLLRYSSEARAMVSNVGLLSPAWLCQVAFKSFTSAPAGLARLGTFLKPTLEGAQLSMDAHLADRAVVLLTTLNELKDGRVLAHKPTDGSCSAERELAALAESAEILSRIRIVLCALGLPDLRSEILPRVASKAKGVTIIDFTLPDGGQINPSFYYAEVVFCKLGLLCRRKPLSDLVFPETFKQVLKLAQDVFCAIENQLPFLTEASDGEDALLSAFTKCAMYLRAASVD